MVMVHSYAELSDSSLIEVAEGCRKLKTLRLSSCRHRIIRESIVRASQNVSQ